MRLKTVTAKGLAHKSYFLSDHNEAMVVDPRRDCAIYVEMAARECTEIKYISKRTATRISSLVLSTCSDGPMQKSGTARKPIFDTETTTLPKAKRSVSATLRLKSSARPGTPTIAFV